MLGTPNDPLTQSNGHSKMKKSNTFLLLSILLLPNLLWANPVEWKLEDGGNGHFYKKISRPGGFSWREAERDAKQQIFRGYRGHLVTVTSLEENSFLDTQFELWAVWIGLSDHRVEGVYEWVTGEEFDWENWGSHEPNNAGNEDFVSYTSDPGQWNDYRDSRTVNNIPYSYIVEFNLSGEKPSDCDENGVPDVIEFETGIHRDCNNTGIPDFCDIDSGDSLDVDQDGIPDECLSSNGNFVADGNTVALWHFNEESGDTLLDSSSNNHHGTIVGATRVRGVEGQALSFDGRNDFVLLGENLFNDNQGTIEAWVKLDSHQSQNTILYQGKIDSFSSGMALMIIQEANKSILQFQHDSRDCNGNATGLRKALSLDNEIELNSWTYVAVTSNGSLPSRLYINGVEVSVGTNGIQRLPTSWFSGLCNGPKSNYLGRWKRSINDEFFSGSIDEMRVSNVARTPEEIFAHWEGRRPPENDCNFNQIEDAIDIATGESTDCNENGVPDTCDLESGESTDLDKNGILDECQELKGSFEITSADESSVAILLQSSVPIKGGELGFSYDSNRMMPFRIEPGLNFPGTREDIVADFNSLNQCTDFSNSTNGVVVGWINEGTGAILPPGEYELFRVYFNAADTQEGGLCTALEFVNCLGVAEAPVLNKLTDESNQAVLVHTQNGEVCSSGDPFKRGDPDNNGVFDITDPIYILGCLFIGTECPSCPDSADVNDDNQVDVTDAILLLSWRFLGGTAPVPPFNNCGFDRTEDALGECINPACK